MAARKGEPEKAVQVVFPNGATGTVSEEQALRCRYRLASEPETPATPAPAALVRAWARENGVECPAKGRIPAAVLDAYSARSE